MTTTIALVRHHRWLVLLSVAAGLGCVLAAQRGHLFLDLAVYQFGGEAVLHRWPLYEVAYENADVRLPFTYPPFAALLLLGVAWVPPTLLAAVWSMLGVLALGAVVTLMLREWSRPVPSYVVPLTVLGALATEPVWSTLAFGQVNLFLMLMVVADLLRGERRGAGLLIGVAAGIKLTPLIFVVFLVLTGRPRAALTAALGFVATVAAGLLLLPRTSLDYWTEVLWDPGRVGGVHYASNQSVMGGMSRVLGHEPSTVAWFLLAGAVALAALLVAARRWRAGERDLAVVLAGLSMLLASPISWSHHWVWGVPAVLALLRAGARLPAALAGLVLLSGMLRWPPRSDDAELGWGVVEQLPGNAYLLGALALLVWCAVTRPGRDRALTCQVEGAT